MNERDSDTYIYVTQDPCADHLWCKGLAIVLQTDPEAAKVVFEAGVRSLTMVPLEVTHTALATPAVLLRIAQRQTPFLQLMQKLLLFFAQTYKEVFNFEHPPLHDPLAVFYVACPSAFTVRLQSLDILI